MASFFDPRLTQPETYGTKYLQKLPMGGVLSVVQSFASTRATALFRQHGGIMRMADVVRSGISRNTLYAMRDAGEVKQLARGLFRLAEMPPLSQTDLVTIAAKSPQAVIYLVSALSFHELATQIPHQVWIAVPRNSEPPRFETPPVRTSRLTGAAYSIGIESHEIDGVIVRVYSPEKTLVDCFARRNLVGLDVALEALRSYVSRGKTNADLVMGYASKLRVAKTMRPYLEAML